MKTRLVALLLVVVACSCGVEDEEEASERRKAAEVSALLRDSINCVKCQEQARKLIEIFREEDAAALQGVSVGARADLDGDPCHKGIPVLYLEIGGRQYFLPNRRSADYLERRHNYDFDRACSENGISSDSLDRRIAEVIDIYCPLNVYSISSMSSWHHEAIVFGFWEHCDVSYFQDPASADSSMMRITMRSNSDSVWADTFRVDAERRLDKKWVYWGCPR